MKTVAERLDEIEESVMGELKDFQRATVERIDYLYKHGQKRILVSDEVGLGKTLVARGSIVKFAKLRKSQGYNLVKIIYICSNATIADQNLEKLRLVNEIHVDGENSRLSMQHLNIFKQENDKSILDGFIQLIPLTPNTSLKFHNREGIVQERALIYAILTKIELFRDYHNELKTILKYDVSDRNWKDNEEKYLNQVIECNDGSNGDYLEFMERNVIKKLEEAALDGLRLKDSIIKLCKSTHIEGFNKDSSRKHIVELRKIFADISLSRLNADLIIMDEFQRFKKDLLDPKTDETEINKLTKKFFNSDVRILMLSATPYKLYSTLDEIDVKNIDVPYLEFIDIIKFLNEDNFDNFNTTWKKYSFKLKECRKDTNSFLITKSSAENELYKNICRTERISENQLSDIIDNKNNINYLSVSKKDIELYRQIQQLLDDLKINKNIRIDYIKSSPYIMSFMENYKLKQDIEEHLKKDSNEVWRMDKDIFWINEDDIERYNRIPYNNARLKNLAKYVLSNNAEKLLWIPPSKPYYEMKGVFKNQEGFSKTLIFSSWEMVPRMISSLISFEVERKTIGKLDKNIKYSSKISRRMQFKEGGSDAQTALFALIYPSLFLKEVYNPTWCLNKKLVIADIEKEIKNKIKKKLCSILEEVPYERSSKEDGRWYFIAPLLLDYNQSRSYVESWFDELGGDECVESNKGFSYHFDSFLREYNMHCKEQDELVKPSMYRSPNYKKLGDIPKDLYDVLCDMAIASPAICAYRSYEKLFSTNTPEKLYFKYIVQLSREFILMMDKRHSISIIDLLYKPFENNSHWKYVLKYSKDGNLQAVFDEYVYLLDDGFDSDNEHKLSNINNKILKNINFGATPYEFDSFDNFKLRIKGNKDDKKTIRSHFAVSFIKGKGDDNDTNRKKSVRNVFNSPFRPFVLTSTSIGQEGLDFHNYCRRIVHWNLPPNPVELEQREGRINRFKCLAIRQNIAKRYCKLDFKSENIWDELFAKAYSEENSNDTSDLIPYWGLKEKEDMIKIERIVPMYPYSRDVTRYKRLMDVLGLYRLTLGQSNQDYLLETMSNCINPNEEDMSKYYMNLSPYYSTFKESIIYNLPIESEFCKLTCNDYKKLSNLNINKNLSDSQLYNYVSALSDKINECDFFKKPLVKEGLRDFGVPLRDLMWDLVRVRLCVRDGFIGTGIYSSNNYKDENLFKFLLNKKEILEEEFDMDLFFKMYEDFSWEISIFSPIDIKLNCKDAVNWHICMSKRFDEVFHDKIFEYYKNHPLKSNKDLINRYWIELFKNLYKTNLIGVEIPHSKPNYHILWNSSNLSDYNIVLHCCSDNKEVRASMVINRNAYNLYACLFKNKEFIEDKIGFKLKWMNNHLCISLSYDIDVNNQKNWSKAIKWQLKTLIKFRKVFASEINEFYENYYND